MPRWETLRGGRALHQLLVKLICWKIDLAGIGCLRQKVNGVITARELSGAWSDLQQLHLWIDKTSSLLSAILSTWKGAGDINCWTFEQSVLLSVMIWWNVIIIYNLLMTWKVAIVIYSLSVLSCIYVRDFRRLIPWYEYCLSSIDSYIRKSLLGKILVLKW